MTNICHQLLAFVYKGRMFAGGGLRECGDTLERLSLVDDDAQWEEVPIKLPQEVFFSCQSCVQE
jgi:hypothetical protein